MNNLSFTEKGCYTDHGVSGYGVAARLMRKEPVSEVLLKEIAEEIMLSIAEKCTELGAKTIGHIKSHIMTEAGTIKADTIGVSHGAFSTGNLKHPVTDIYMAINSIVQGIPEEAVKAATLEGLHEVADKEDLTVVKEKEHTYFDEFDFMTSKQEYLRQLEEQFSSGDTENDLED